MKKIIVTIFIFLIGGVLSFLIFNNQNIKFENLSASEMYEKIIEQRDLAINQAIASGNYGCCIDPPCTMCYMEANQWNNFIPGTCGCDDFIARGEEPCPQCKRGIESGQCKSSSITCPTN
ncbi:hypothetical protein L6279_04365 [Candidatus Parcubacteria bacterium]|nr:hypothetical protein [Patescibacteria group bacterium]MCG2693305.1 hypothetical protein [Candidatus Parcubacteria bacterium]